MLDDLEAKVLDGIDSWLIQVHGPVNVGDGEIRAVCRRCRTPHPCPSVMEVVKRRDARHAAAS